MPLPEKDEIFNTRGRMLQNIMVGLGGRIAEELVFDDITTGASQDIKQATALARAMVTKYGMSDKIGLINYVLYACANLLLEKEKIGKEEFEALFEEQG